MHIVCPHCTTSYAIDPAKLGDAGRTVRCSRCKEVWLARPEDVQSDVRVAAMTVEEQQPATNDLANDPGWGVTEDEQDTPVVESPPITADLPGQGDQDPFTRALANEPAPGDDEEPLPPRRKRKPSFGSKRKPRSMKERLTELRKEPLKAAKGLLNAPLAIAVFGSVALGLLIWRADIVRLMPQTAAFYRLIGFEVNLRGLAIKDVRISRETVESKPVLVIQGVIIGQAKRRSTCRGYGSRCAMPRAPRSTPGTRSSNNRRCGRARSPGSERASPRRRRRRARSTCASSTGATLPPAGPEGMISVVARGPAPAATRE